MKPELSQIFFPKKKNHSKTNFHENPSSGNRVAPCGQTDGRMDRHNEADFAFRNFANGPTKTGNVYVRRNTEARSCNHCCNGKEVLRILSVCL
jgi:hypothetical protein